MMDSVRFSREEDEWSVILGPHWRAEIHNIAVTRSTLTPFFPDPAHSTIELYVAGKDDGPNPMCLETASQALADLEGFEYRGERHASLSKIAREISGTNWNGFLYFGLQRRTRKLNGEGA